MDGGMTAKAVQLRPSNTEAIISLLEDLAAQAKDGEIVGLSFIVFKSGGGFTTNGVGEGTSLQAMGAHFSAALAIHEALAP